MSAKLPHPVSTTTPRSSVMKLILHKYQKVDCVENWLRGVQFDTFYSHYPTIILLQVIFFITEGFSGTIPLDGSHSTLNNTLGGKPGANNK